jgi:hypothetical protein
MPLVITLLCTLLIAPPGSSVVWPFPESRHLHIGWVSPSGFSSSSLLVYSHPAAQTVAADRRPASARPYQSGGAALVTPQPSVEPWMVYSAGLLWALTMAAIFIPGSCPLPEEPPPRAIIG